VVAGVLACATGCGSTTTATSAEGGVVDAGTVGRPTTPQCIPGMAAACACVDGSMGAQTCNADGSYAPCFCAARPDAGAVVDVPPVDDVPPVVDVAPVVDVPPVVDAGADVPVLDVPTVVDVPSTDLGVADVPPVDRPPPCGPGTYVSDGGCLPLGLGDGGLTYYDLRLTVDRVTGDGTTAVPVLALGREADGAPSTRDVIFWLSRPGAGTVTPSARLTAAGATVSFVPCNAASSPACAGTVRVYMALASAPTVPVAMSAELTITDQVAVGTPAACLGGGNIAYVNGDPGDYISAGRSYTFRAPLVTVRMDSMTFVSAQLGDFGDYRLEFSTNRLGAPLAMGVYENAMRYPFESTGRPGLSLSGMGRGCNMLTGRFQIHTLAVGPSGLNEITATFEQHCEGGSTAARGCIHWQR